MFSFYIITLISLLFFLDRRIDLFTISFASATVYFLPAFIIKYPISDDQYFIYFIVYFSILVGGLFSVSERNELKLNVNDDMKCYMYLCLLLSMSIFIYFILNHGISEFLVYKTQQKRSSMLNYMWTTFLGLAFLIAFQYKNIIVLSLCFIQYLFALISGDRTQLTIALLSVFVFVFYKTKSPLIILKEVNIKLFIGIVLIILVGFYGKDFYGAIQDSNVSGESIFYSLNKRLEKKESITQDSEPYHTQLILKYVVENDTRIDSSYLLKLPIQLLPWSGEMGGDAHEHSLALKRLFFKSWGGSTGVASNYWAEGFTFTGIFGVIIFCMIFILLIYFLQRIIERTSGIWKFSGVFMAVYWTFYINRNSLFQMIGHEKRIIYATLALTFLFFILKKTFCRNN